MITFPWSGMEFFWGIQFSDECDGGKMTRQKDAHSWAVRSFGPIALNRDERAARLVEEAIEVAQAEGLAIDMLQRIAERVYSRPVGTLSQEIGGLQITLDILAENAGIDAQAEGDRELARVLALPPDWWKKKHAEKVAAGTADLSPIAINDPITGFDVPAMAHDTPSRDSEPYEPRN